MKRIITAIISVCSFLSLGAQEIVKGEYFFNTDPGYNNGIEISIEANEKIDTEIDITFPSELSYGFNTLYMRFLDENNVWSHKLSRAIFVNKSESQISSIEYYYVSNDDETTKQVENIGSPSIEIDTALFLDAGSLEDNKNYSLYAVALDEFGVRSFSARKDFVFHVNNDPEVLKASLSLSISVNGVLNVSMDSLFSDLDIVLGDSLVFEIDNSDNQNLSEIISWKSSELLEFSTEGENATVYNFDIIATDLMGKKAIIPTTLTIFSSTGVDNQYADGFRIYPNPVCDYLFIENIKGGVQGYIQIYNLQGQVVLEEPLENRAGIDVSQIGKGVYILKISKAEQSFAKQLIIQH